MWRRTMSGSARRAGTPIWSARTRRAACSMRCAARQLRGIELDGRVVVWGTRRAAIRRCGPAYAPPGYAPDLTILGIAALAPASDLRALIAAGQSSMFGKIVSSYLARLRRPYPRSMRLRMWGRSRARWSPTSPAAASAAGERCSRCSKPRCSCRAASSRARPTDGPLGDLLRNTPNGPIAPPVLIAQGQVDDLVLPDIQRRFVDERRAAGAADRLSPLSGARPSSRWSQPVRR